MHPPPFLQVWGRPFGSAAQPDVSLRLWNGWQLDGARNEPFSSKKQLGIVKTTQTSIKKPSKEPRNEPVGGSHAERRSIPRMHAGARSEPACTLKGQLAMDSKRKANSPCESDKIKTTKTSTPNSSLEFFSPISEFEESLVSTMSETGMDNDRIITVTYTVESRNGEKFTGAIDRPTAVKLWELGLKLPKTLIYGIGLNQSLDRFFLIDFDLKEEIEWNECPKSYEAEVDGVKYFGQKFLQKAKAPELGEEVMLKIRKTRFKLRQNQVARWIEHFGTIVKNPDFEDAPDMPTVKSDDIIITVKLRKHVPSILPAYGRRMIINYPGQPILCGKCFELGHMRKNCEAAEQVKWAAFVKFVGKMDFVSKEMLGSWAELL